jgi:hypothetical protein
LLSKTLIQFCWVRFKVAFNLTEWTRLVKGRRNRRMA